MRMLVLVLLATGCDALMAGPPTEEVERLRAEQQAMIGRMDALELRVLSLEAKATASVPVPEPLAPEPAASPRPAPRPLVVPPTPKPAPAPVVPTGPVGKVQIASPRDGLSIVIDDIERTETTPALILLPPGRHTVEVEGYEEQEIRVIENETVMVIPH